MGDLEERADALQDGCAQFEKQVRDAIKFAKKKLKKMYSLKLFVLLFARPLP